MKPLRVLLIDTSVNKAEVLKTKLKNLHSMKFIVRPASIQNAEETFLDMGHSLDIILINENVPVSAIVNLTKTFRGRNVIVPIFLLTKISEAKLAKKIRSAGMDDVLNTVELETPLSSWTFSSIVEHTMRKRKAKQYDILQHRIKNLNESLATLMHDINNPLSVVRLAVYHLEKPDASAEKRETFIKILINNLDKLDSHLKELTIIRRQLNDESVQYAPIIPMKSGSAAIASK